ncbi:1,4-dihydroxy-2-naphthoate polyprenyltransferase [Knoellia subterranea]|uniref:1,4-dihydroxy-2-naphthoate octaprenyltransferase n=1 Tax=Knoellia subterranea KCTC 19937 TaxID=1385521 RepID=A0A0A0JRG7_9MICO|nr:1,4-dihydroxy-2-naphthoate polyprenyltransferase [Knoellia subterranea]KGN38191.1 1,4-dihydroxy-2-naphthoate prenyltransferase [Knoellia subterranea KCTC 19937]
MATFQQWVAGARPRTLFAAIAPVVIGTAAAAQHSEPSWAIALLAAIVALALQIGVNFANDYSDGIRGTDDSRVGPVRLVGQKLARPESVKAAAFLTFGFAAITGLALVALAEAWWLLPLGVASIWAAWKYTGGDNPYGYRGLGELFVFVFFGLVATLGTMYAETGTLSWFALAAAVGVGAIASAILVVNNLRDIPTDQISGKQTLAVRIGDTGTRRLWLGLIVVSILCIGIMAIWNVWALVGLLSIAAIWRAVTVVMGGAEGRRLVPVLGSTGKYELVYAVAVFAGVFISRALA